MPTNTYVELQKVTVGTATNSITFSSINQGYTDLVLVVSGRSSRTADEYEGLGIRFNSDTGSNYSATTLAGTGGAASSFRVLNQTNIESRINTSVSSNTAPSANTIQIQNYSNTTTNKTVLIRSNSSVEFYGVTATVGLWRNTAAITSITLYPTQLGSQFTAGSTFSLYGIAADANAYTAKATGGTITADVGYIYHTFTSSGTFTPSQSLSCDTLVIAGGGAGGYQIAGGGGAGGLVYTPSTNFGTSGYTVTVGAGGANTTSGSPRNSGSNSNITGTGISLTAAVGGGGGGSYNSSPERAGLTGGSGGGGAGLNGTGGSATSGQGSIGGNGSYSGARYVGAGGGGAGANGGSGNPGASAAGDGGAGSSAYSVWGLATSTGQNISGTYYYAGGGGGGNFLDSTSSNTGAIAAGGYGGGGTGGRGNNTTTQTLPVAGTANTGGGGGASASYGYGTQDGFAGGSGIVIIRYAK